MRRNAAGSLLVFRDLAAEGGQVALPLRAEREDQHLFVNMDVLGQRAHPAAARRREHLIGLARALVKLGQRRDGFAGRASAVAAQPELALVALVLLGRDVDGVEGAVLGAEA